MHRKRERLSLKAEERRRSWAFAALLLGGLGIVVAAFVFGAWFFATALRGPGPPPPELLRPRALFLALPLLALAVGLTVRLRPKNFVEVDVEAGTAAFFEGGEARRDETRRRVALEEIGPLRHAVEQRRVKSGKSYRDATFHVARSVPSPELLIHESEDELETRRALEARSKAWRVPYVKPSGEVRRPELRGRTLPLRSIEEIDRVRGGGPRLVSDQRFLEIDPDFCEGSDLEWLRHELRRLVIEVGLRSPAP